MDSFYRAYFATLFESFGQRHVPVYIRWAREKEYQPLYFSANESDLYLPRNKIEGLGLSTKSLPSHQYTCFERVIRRTDLHYGAIPTVSVSAVQVFKQTAYDIVNRYPPQDLLRSGNDDYEPLTTHLRSSPPFRILLSYRGPRSTRYIENIDAFVVQLKIAFPTPAYHLQVYMNDNASADCFTQIQLVGQAHVVITNHGAFEGNMIYMKNSSLLLEMLEDHGNNKDHTFDRLAMMFGMFYARHQFRHVQEHNLRGFNMTMSDMEEIIAKVKDYFAKKAYSPSSM